MTDVSLAALVTALAPPATTAVAPAPTANGEPGPAFAALIAGLAPPTAGVLPSITPIVAGRLTKSPALVIDVARPEGNAESDQPEDAQTDAGADDGDSASALLALLTTPPIPPQTPTMALVPAPLPTPTSVQPPSPASASLSTSTPIIPPIAGPPPAPAERVSEAVQPNRDATVRDGAPAKTPPIPVASNETAPEATGPPVQLALAAVEADAHDQPAEANPPIPIHRVHESERTATPGQPVVQVSPAPDRSQPEKAALLAHAEAMAATPRSSGERSPLPVSIHAETRGARRAAEGIADRTPARDGAPVDIVAGPMPASPSGAMSAPAAVAPGQAAPADAIVYQQLAIAQDGQWLDSLAHDIAATGGSDSMLRFTLSPDHLGPLTVQIAQGADGASVRLTTETHTAHAMLVDAQPRLVAEARAQGLTLRETNIDLAGGGAGNMAQQHRGGGQMLSGGSGGEARRQTSTQSSPDLATIESRAVESDDPVGRAELYA